MNYLFLELYQLSSYTPHLRQKENARIIALSPNDIMIALIPILI